LYSRFIGRSDFCGIIIIIIIIVIKGLYLHRWHGLEGNSGKYYVIVPTDFKEEKKTKKNVDRWNSRKTGKKFAKILQKIKRNNRGKMVKIYAIITKSLRNIYGNIVKQSDCRKLFQANSEKFNKKLTRHSLKNLARKIHEKYTWNNRPNTLLEKNRRENCKIIVKRIVESLQNTMLQIYDKISEKSQRKRDIIAE
jgi:hypothetical protein